MAKVNYSSINKKEKNKTMDELYNEIAGLDGGGEVKSFLNGLLTESEQIMLSRRLQIAKMLLEGFSYDEICENLQTGKTTIIAVDRWLNQGIDGYRAIVKDKKDKAISSKHSDFPLSFKSLRRKYPAHFWLLNLILDD